jgi:hypothetical protein
MSMLELGRCTAGGAAAQAAAAAGEAVDDYEKGVAMIGPLCEN